MKIEERRLEVEAAGVALFETLKLWVDPVPRSGPEAMAVDEWCLNQMLGTLLRVYRWDGAWGSLGYFGKLAEAEASFPGLQWVRRWTGGGTVDHRLDWTYSLMIPPSDPVFQLKGAESYRLIHEAVGKALQSIGIYARLSGGEAETGAAACFENPVRHDLVDADGKKLGGAGQRRTKVGLLHQGSVGVHLDSAACQRLAEAFAGEIAVRWESKVILPDERQIESLCEGKYSSRLWTQRR